MIAGNPAVRGCTLCCPRGCGLEVEKMRRTALREHTLEDHSTLCG